MTFCGRGPSPGRGGSHGSGLPAPAPVPGDHKLVLPREVDAFAVQYFSAGLELGRLRWGHQARWASMGFLSFCSLPAAGVILFNNVT